jgi:hypothetical protein
MGLGQSSLLLAPLNAVLLMCQSVSGSRCPAGRIWNSASSSTLRRATDGSMRGLGVALAVHGEPFYTLRALRVYSKPKPRRK